MYFVPAEDPETAVSRIVELVAAYSATVHKCQGSQGSEYPAVVISVLTQHHAMLRRNLLYAGVMWGKRLVVLVRQKSAGAIGVRNASGRKSWSKLDEWLDGSKKDPPSGIGAEAVSVPGPPLTAAIPYGQSGEQDMAAGEENR